MILGVLWAKKSYPMRKYGFVTMITCGVMLFLMKDFSFKINTGSFFGFGEFLLVRFKQNKSLLYYFQLVSLALDGLTGAVQDDLRMKFNIRAYDLMLNMNVWSLLYLFPGII